MGLSLLTLPHIRVGGSVCARTDAQTTHYKPSFTAGVLNPPPPRGMWMITWISRHIVALTLTVVTVVFPSSFETPGLKAIHVWIIHPPPPLQRWNNNNLTKFQKLFLFLFIYFLLKKKKNLVLQWRYLHPFLIFNSFVKRLCIPFWEEERGKLKRVGEGGWGGGWGRGWSAKIRFHSPQLAPSPPPSPDITELVSLAGEIRWLPVGPPATTAHTPSPLHNPALPPPPPPLLQGRASGGQTGKEKARKDKKVDLALKQMWM